MITKNSPVPIYLQIAQVIRGQIINEEYKVDDKIPTEEELVKRYGVSRMTARNAVSQLVNEGLVCRVHGVGAFVSREKLKRNLNRLTGFYEDMKELGYKPSSKVLLKERRRPNQREQIALGLTKEQEVFYISRIRMVDDDPVGLQSMVVPVYRVPDLDQINLSNTSFYTYLEEKNLAIEKAEQRMEAVNAPNICKEIGLEDTTPLFFFERVSYTEEQEPIELLDSYFRGDFYSYYITLYR